MIEESHGICIFFLLSRPNDFYVSHAISIKVADIELALVFFVVITISTLCTIIFAKPIHRSLD